MQGGTGQLLTAGIGGRLSVGLMMEQLVISRAITRECGLELLPLSLFEMVWESLFLWFGK